MVKSAAVSAPFVPPHPSTILSTEEVAQWLGLPKRQVTRLGIPAIRLGHRTVRFKTATVQAWLDQRARTTTNKKKARRRS